MRGIDSISDRDLPLVTIVTPSFNQGEFVADAIDSVLAQDYPRIEYLVIDGGSSDDTLEVLGRQTSRVRWISEPDRGQGDAIRKGFALAQGEILAWLNSDDVYLPGAVSRAVAAFQESSSVVLVYGNAEFIDGAGAVLGPCEQVEPFDLGRLINDLDFIVQPATFFRREPYFSVGGLDPSLTYCLDYELWIRMAQRGAASFIPDVLAQVRIYPQTKTASGGLARLDEVERMIRGYGRKTLPTEFEREMVGALRRHAQGAVAKGHLKTGAVDVWRGGRYAMRLARRRGFRWVTGSIFRRLTQLSRNSPPRG
jgi:glycosyltransferase involved in cell wall biosynthesis